jgi:propionyl-CoA carboxylase alpha chain
MFAKILIANRGEIAVRIMRTCRRMGIRSVAVFSDTDFRGLHVAMADEAVEIGTARPSESYLAKEKIIATALANGCEAIHPGYGFLSENAQFARMVEEAGLTFIGPPSSVIAALGDKLAAKDLAMRAGVPTVPGNTRTAATLDEARELAEAVGYPVLLKPAAGGGGKGMRTVDSPDGLASALRLCQQETRKAFGDDRIFVERFIRRPRHIEIQILADRHGRTIHLGERECSVQRRYQKIIEESPSVAIDEPLRQRMGQMACALAQTAGYVNAGTVEFILDSERNFYFLEMNTRLQVEHAVTELVTGLDLVELQLRIAAGEQLSFRQEEVRRTGWAIEARICAEDTTRDFMPSVGLITRYAEPRGKQVRVDSGVSAGSIVNVFYDPMLSKVITWGEDREAARRRMVQALNGYHIEGVSTNIDFANQVLTHPAFLAGELSTDFIPRHLLGSEVAGRVPTDEDLHPMAIATSLIYHLRRNLVKESLAPLKAQVGSTPQSQRTHRYMVKSEKDIFEIEIDKQPLELNWHVAVNGRSYHVVTPPMEFYRRRLKLSIDGKTCHFRLRTSGNFTQAAFNGVVRTFEIYNRREWELARFMPPPPPKAPDNALICPMPGLVVEVKVAAGQKVFRGQELITIESMKMESAIASPMDGEVAEVNAKPGDTVETGAVLVAFKI